MLLDRRTGHDETVGRCDSVVVIVSDILDLLFSISKFNFCHPPFHHVRDSRCHASYVSKVWFC